MELFKTFIIESKIIPFILNYFIDFGEVFMMIADKKVRLDRFLSENLGISRSQIAQLIAKNAVQINGKIANKSGILLKNGDEIQIVESLKSPLGGESLTPKSDIFIEKIYEDDDILVLNKPPFLATHGAPSLKEESLVDWLKAHKIRLSTISGETRMGIIHRLDKQTSGAIVVAKNNIAHSLLSAQLADKSMGRIYLAIIDLPLREDLEVECYLGRNPKNRLKMSKIVIKDSRIDSRGESRNFGANRGESHKILGADSSADSPKDSRIDSHLDLPKIPRGVRYSKSRFTKLLTSKDGTKELICAQLFTGRTHQIRAHLESINRHIIGDELYGYKSANRAKNDSKNGENPANPAQYRVMLHSYLLYLAHPKDCKDSAKSHSKNAKMLFLANLFDDMNHFLEKYFDMEKVDEILRDLPKRFSF